MATIDDKVVAMSFDSKKFESGVSDTISALDRLKKALHFPDAGKGFEAISRAAGHIQLNRIGDAADNVQKRLRAMQLVAIGVLSNLAASAVRSGARFVKSFTLQPLIQGFQEYSTNLNSIQTILANTQASGADLQDVNKALDQLNTYSDKTIYNFGQMARNIGTFTAAGVDLKTSTASIKGIANLAALSGSNAEQASTAMYQLSQAISAGRVGLQDWNSVVNAGMGGTVFQRALAQTAEAMGTIKKGAVELKGPMKNVSIEGKSFRQSITPKPGEDSWLTSKVLTTTLKQFTGELSDAELAAMGFNKAQIKAIQQTAKTAMHAATEVKTISQVFDVAKETMGSGWAQTFRTIFGDFEESKKTFTDMSNAINGFINTNAAARNKVLADWKALGGRTLLINSIKEAFQNLGMIVDKVKDGFRDVFPPTTGKDLFNLTKAFQKFAEALKPGPDTMRNIERTFRGVAAAFDIGFKIIKGIVTMFQHLFNAVGGGQGKVVQFSGDFGTLIWRLDKFLDKGDKVNKFFAKMGDFLAKPLNVLKQVAGLIGSLFSGFSPGGFSDKMDGMTKAMTPFERIMHAIAEGWGKFVDHFQGSDNILKKVFDAITKGIVSFGEGLANAVNGVNWEGVLEVIRTGLFAGIVVMLKKFLGKGSALDQITNVGGGFMKKISGSLDALQGSLKAMQTNIKADTLKKIAVSVGLLAASVTALSLVDPTKLKGALAAMTVAFGELLGAMKILTVVSGTKGFLAIPAISFGLILLAGAIDTIAIAVIALSFLSWESLIKGLAGVGALLIGISKAAIPLSKNSKGLIAAGVGITAIGIGLNFMALAVRQLGKLDLKSLGKGLGAVAASLVILIATLEEMPAANMIAIGAGLIGVGVGMRILASAVAAFAKMNAKDIFKGLASVGAALVIIAGAMDLMPPDMPLIAAGILIVSFALGRIAKAVMLMAGMSWKEIARGLVALGGALAILAGGLLVMQESVGGAVALGVAAAGITVLATALKKLGSMSWKQIVKGLVAMGAAIGILAGASLLLSEAIPLMLGLGVAMLALGAGLALAGAGVFLIGAGLGAIAASGSAAIAILVQAVIDLSKAFPELGKNLILGLLEIVNMLAKVAPKFMDALAKIINSLVDLIIREAPKIATAFIAIIDAILKILHDRQDKIIQAGIDLLIALLNGIKKNIGQVVKIVADIIVKFLNAVSSNISRIVAAGANVVISLVKGIAGQLTKIASAAIDIVVKFVTTIISLYPRIITAAVGVMTKFLGALATKLPDLIRAGTNLITNLVTGIGKATQSVIDAAIRTAIKFVHHLAVKIPQLVDGVASAIILLLNKTADVIEKREPEIIRATARIGAAIIKGMVFAIKDGTNDIKDALLSLLPGPLKKFAGKLGITSPSKVFYDFGSYIVQGLANGITANEKEVTQSADSLATGFIGAIKSVFQITSPSKVMFQLGQFVMQGFHQGLLGSTSDIKDVWAKLNEDLLTSMQGTREDIGKERQKLKELMDTTTPDLSAIRQAQAVLSKDEEILRRQSSARNVLIVGLKAQKAELLGLAAKYESISNALDTAKQKLADLKKEREDAIKGFSDQYSTLPDIVKEDAEGNAVDQLATYMGALKNQADAVAAYQSTLDQLRQLGLDDATYQKLLEEGTADQQFATQLLAGGKTAVQGLNALDAQLKKNADTLASHAGHNLKDAGIAAAQGVVKGLQSQETSIRKEMERIARIMVTALNNELKSHSPSQVFAEIGGYAMEGLAIGLTDSSNLVTNAVEAVGSDAVSAMQKSISDISNAVVGSIDASPTITPILDLTQVRSQTGELASLTDISPITAAASYQAAAAISSQQAATSTEAPDISTVAPHVQFVQTNTSPVALSEVEIYRQTKNQLAQFSSAFVGGS